jgi:RimJ/RimL family protein N-acetyltransferase
MADAATPELRTERLLLRAWRDSDREPFAAMNADPVVMQHFPTTLTRAQSDAMIERQRERWAAGDPALWAAERTDTGEFIGFIGLALPHFDAPFTPCVEVGWRLAADHWGHGFAPEGATAAMVHGFDVLALDEIVSFTSPGNANSRRVMEKLGLHHDPADDFDHPNLPPGHRLRRHVLYRVARVDWPGRTGSSGATPSTAPLPTGNLS